MKELVKTSRTAGQLEKIFRELSTDLFNGELEEPIITLSPSNRTYGHVTIIKNWTVKEEKKYELNISSTWLDRPIENIITTLIHEMCHLWNMAHDIKDTSRGTVYHNKKFKECAETHLLKVEFSEKYGWCETQPTDELIEYILTKGWEEIKICRDVENEGRINKGPKGGEEGSEKKRTSSTRKLACPCCGNSVRATKTINILCGDCMEKMLEV